MTGPDHYREAERLLTEEISVDPSGAEVHRAFAVAVAAAQVHATLALAAATALGSSAPGSSEMGSSEMGSSEMGSSAAEARTWAGILGTKSS